MSHASVHFPVMYMQRKFPAYGKKFANCGKGNHFAIMCKEENAVESEDEHNKVHEIEYKEYILKRKTYVIE